MTTAPAIPHASSRKHRLPDVIMLLAILWLRLPVAFGSAPPTTVRILALLPLVLGIAVLLPLPRANRTVSLLGTLLGIFVLLTVVALLRGASAGAYETLRHVIYQAVGICLLVAFGYVYIASALSDTTWAHRMFILCCAPGVYIAINVVLHIGGYHGPTTPGEPIAAINAGTPAELLGLVGVHSTRVLFPFANGVNNFGDIAGVATVISATLAIKVTGRQRLVTVLLFLTAIYALLATDARAALLFSIAGAVLVLLLGHRRWLAGVALLVPATTVVTTFVLGLVSHTDLVGTFSRNGDNLITATNRTTIWHAVFAFLSHPNLTHLYGYGANGQISSGASFGYAYLFVGAAHPEQYTAHNFMLQTVLDIGYVGLLVFVLLVFFAARALQRMIVIRKSNPARALLGALVFLVFAGATDGAPSLYTPETLYFLFVMVAAIAATSTTLRRGERRYPKATQRVAPTTPRYYRETQTTC